MKTKKTKSNKELDLLVLKREKSQKDMENTIHRF